MKQLLKMFLLLIFIFSSNLSALEIKTNYQLKQHIEKIKKNDLMDILRRFVDASKPNRFVGTTGHEKARAVLKEIIKEFDPEKNGHLSSHNFSLNVATAKKHYQDEFDEKVVPHFKKEDETYKKMDRFKSYMQSQIEKKKDTQGENIVWEKKGSRENAKTIVLTAHYDTVSHVKKDMAIDEGASMPGADFNASGVSVLLALIKTLAPIKFEENIKIVFLDFQSLALMGSYEFSKTIKEDKNILGILNLEMLGHDSRFYDKKKQIGNMKAYLRSSGEDDELLELTKKYAKGHDVGIRFSPLKNDFASSDNIRFWESGISSITFSQDWENDFNEKRFQTAQDFPETLNQDTFYRVYLYFAGFTAQFLRNSVK